MKRGGRTNSVISICLLKFLLEHKNVLAFDPTPEVEGVCRDIIFACMLLHLTFPFICYATYYVLKNPNVDHLIPP